MARNNWHPLVQNFDLADFALGNYTVGLTGLPGPYSIYEYDARTGLVNEGTVEITGNTPNLFVNFTTKKFVDQTNNPNRPETPAEGYVRVTFTNGTGVEPINVVYDVKEGESLTSAEYPTPVVSDGYSNPVWSVEPGTPFTTNTTVTATATPNIPVIEDFTPQDPDPNDNNLGPEVTADSARVIEGQEISPIPVVVKDDNLSSVSVSGLPDGLSYNPTSSQIEGTPSPLNDWGATEEERNFPATITATDEDNNVTEKNITITVLRDTDGDGNPDVTDTDDDNDGIPDTEDQNPKVWDPNVTGPVETPVSTQPSVDQYEEKISNLPEGLTVTIIQEPDVSTPGDKEATVEVTLPGGNTVTVTIPVTVLPSQADTNDPRGRDQTVDIGQTPNPEDSISNKDELPEGTSYTFKEPVDTTTPGDKPADVVVTVAEPPITEPEVSLPTNPETYNPVGQKQVVELNESPEAVNSIANSKDLPEGTSYEFKEPVDTSTPGDKPATIVVTYPDGSSEEVVVVITVNPPVTQADTYTSVGEDQSVDLNETPGPLDSIANEEDLPTGTSFEWKETPDTSTEGEKPATVVVTYPDGSIDEVPVVVTVVDEKEIVIRVDDNTDSPVPDGYVRVYFDPHDPDTVNGSLAYNPQFAEGVVIAFDVLEGTTWGEAKSVAENPLVVPTATPSDARYDFVGWEPSLPADDVEVVTATYVANYQAKDSDNDGLNDGDEISGAKNPFDNDGDGKGDPTDPNKADTDGDGIQDLAEMTGYENDGEPTDPNTPNQEDDNNGPVTDDRPVNDSDDGSTPSESSGGATSSRSSGTAPRTGDTTNILVYLGLILLAGLALVGVYKKRKSVK